jgi:hypothetical protein
MLRVLLRPCQSLKADQLFFFADEDFFEGKTEVTFGENAGPILAKQFDPHQVVVNEHVLAKAVVKVNLCYAVEFASRVLFYALGGGVAVSLKQLAV